MFSSFRKTDSAMAQLLKSSSELSVVLKEGDLVSGRFLGRMQRAVYFDLGKFGTGIVYGIELANARELLKSMKDGDAITAKVVEVENDEGYIELSLASAGKQKAWQNVKDLYEKGEDISVKIIGTNTGGLLAEVEGIKAFLPVSQLSNEHYPRVEDGDKNKILGELKKFISQALVVKILDVNPRAEKLILSEREVASKNLQEKLTKYKAGDIIDGIISGVADFGAFVKFTDDPEVEGLIHISELDHRLIENPKEIVKVNDQVKMKIIEIKDGRVTLSLKALKPDPWDKVGEKYQAATDIQGKILRFNPFGAFVALDSEIQGLIHVSEFGSVEEMKKRLEEGQIYNFHIESVKPQEKRIILKMPKTEA